MRGHVSLKATLLLTGALAALAPAAAQAEQAQAGTSAHAEGEVVVTARRREERVQDVPLAVTALSADALERQGVTDIQTLNGRIVGLVVSQSQGAGAQAPVYAIRGQNQQELSGLSDPSVTLYVDDVPVPRAQGSNLSFFDMAGLEVARGPQGTLFGRNTTGGAILMRTAQPAPTFSAHIVQTAGNFDAFTTEGMINVPLSDAVSVRISGQHVERSGYITDIVTGKEVNDVNQNAARIAISLHPTAGFENVLSFNYSNADDGGTAGFVAFSQSALYAPTGADPVGPVAAQRARSPYRIASGVPAFASVENWSVTNRTTYELNENYALKNIIAYRSVDAHNYQDLDGSERIIFPVERLLSQTQFSEELQLQATFDRFDFILGGFYFREEISDQALSAGSLTAGGVPFGGDPVFEAATLRDYRSATGSPNYSNTWALPTNTSYAVFAQGTYKFTDQFSATLGLRQTWDEREAIVRNRAYQPTISTAGLTCRFTLDEDNNPATPETRPSLANCNFTSTAKFDEPTYDLSLNYKPTSDMLLYAAYRHGYRTGGFGARANTQASLNDTFDPETVDDIEIGVKADWRLGDMFLRTNLALYSDRYEGAQRFLAKGQAPPVTVTENAQEAEIKGSELEVIFRPNDLFELSGFWAYTDAKFTEYRDPNGVNLAPQVYPHVPENMYSVTARMNLPTPESVGDMSLSLTYYRQDREDSNDTYAALTDATGALLPLGSPTTPNTILYRTATNNGQIIPGHKTVNASFDWNAVVGSNVDLSLFINNVLDETYLMQYQGIDTFFESRTPSPPRMWGVRVKVHFE